MAQQEDTGAMAGEKMWTGDGEESWRNLNERKQQVESDARVLLDDIRAMKEELAYALPISEMVREKPYTYLLYALGAGFIMGGGLTAKLTKKLMMLGLMKVGMPMARAYVLDTILGSVKTGEEGTKRRWWEAEEESERGSSTVPGQQGMGIRPGEPEGSGEEGV